MNIRKFLLALAFSFFLGSTAYACLAVQPIEPVECECCGGCFDANETAAVSILRKLSTAAETYATTHNGYYPRNAHELSYDRYYRHYRTSNYCGGQYSGYNFQCSLGTSGYVMTATPVVFGQTGNTVFQISTGGILTEI